jgi:hypothetical protein
MLKHYDTVLEGFFRDRAGRAQVPVSSTLGRVHASGRPCGLRKIPAKQFSTESLAECDGLRLGVELDGEDETMRGCPGSKQAGFEAAPIEPHSHFRQVFRKRVV